MKAGLCALWIAAAAIQPALAAETYTMDAAHCIPSFEFTHLGMTTQSGRFDRAWGNVTLDRTTHRGSVRYEIDTASLNMGFGTEKPDSPGYRLFRVEKFPTITFSSDDLHFSESGKVVAAQGKLTLLGVTKPVTVWVGRFSCGINSFNKKAMCAGNITATVKRSEFGMTEFLPAIGDEVGISVPVEAYKD